MHRDTACKIVMPEHYMRSYTVTNFIIFIQCSMAKSRPIKQND